MKNSNKYNDNSDRRKLVEKTRKIEKISSQQKSECDHFYFPILKRQTWKNFQPVYANSVKELHMEILKSEIENNKLLHFRIKPNTQTHHPLYKNGIERELFKHAIPIVKQSNNIIVCNSDNGLNQNETTATIHSNYDKYAMFLYDGNEEILWEEYEECSSKGLFLDTTFYHMQKTSMALEIALSLRHLKQLLQDFQKRDTGDFQQVFVYMMTSTNQEKEMVKANVFRYLAIQILNQYKYKKIRIHLHGITSLLSSKSIKVTCRSQGNCLLSGIYSGYDSLEVIPIWNGRDSIERKEVDDANRLIKYFYQKRTSIPFGRCNEKENSLKILWQNTYEQTLFYYRTLLENKDFVTLLQSGYIQSIINNRLTNKK